MGTTCDTQAKLDPRSSSTITTRRFYIRSAQPKDPDDVR